jgi:hypothetical protein
MKLWPPDQNNSISFDRTLLCAAWKASRGPRDAAIGLPDVASFKGVNGSSG